MADAPYPGPIAGSYWVIPGQLMAGPYPGGWDEARARQRLGQVIDAGITLFVDLTETGELKPYASWLPPGVSHRRFPIEDMAVPLPALMLTILDTIDRALADGKVIYLHCMGGIGRTGTAVGCYLVRHGMAGTAALEEIIRLRGGLLDSPQTDEQFSMVRDWREDGP